MAVRRARPIVPLVFMLLVGTALPVAGQTIDVVPTMPPAPICPAQVASPEPSSDPPASPGATVSASPLPSPDLAGHVVRALPPTRSTTPEKLRLWHGSWDEPWGDVAIAPRTGAVVATLPEGPFRTILWGGVGVDDRLLDDGVMIDDSGATRVLPAAPICPRRDFAWSVAGSGVMIWGGTDDAGRPFGDGAYYSLAFGTWSILPPAPLPPGPAVAAGNAVLVRDPETGRAVLSRIENLDDGPMWTQPVDVPLPAGAQYEVVSGRDSAPLLVFSIDPGRFAYAASKALEYPHEGDWTQLGQVPLPAGVGGRPVTGRATERDLTMWARSTDAAYPGTDLSGPYGVIMRTNRPGRPWQLTAPAPEEAVGDPSLVLSPTHLISAQGMVAYDLMAERWLRLPSRAPSASSARFGSPEGATAWWSDRRLWVFGGRAPDGSMESRLWTFTPKLPRNERPLTYRPDLSGYGEGCLAFATEGTWRLRGSPDDQLVVWTQSGSKRQDTNWPEGWVARFDPKLKVVDTRGRVRYRDGDVCRTDPGTGG